jgi:hypothetical protein
VEPGTAEPDTWSPVESSAYLGGPDPAGGGSGDLQAAPNPSLVGVLAEIAWSCLGFPCQISDSPFTEKA